ncbi:hypothetical protein N8I77_005538 [Diaporthe amygdali]|uniref:NACHT domain-containing protein n=1 Tax=Phomopsis amygdali TaxID=1214568 RepID=A0AAD9SF46_PHOAM|nr:hypothetical protein N8I77_005538 [Diaporthe amygdali]
MDPLTAIGLASNIISFIDFSVRLLKGFQEIHDSQHGALEENKSRETITREMQHMSAGLLLFRASDKVEEDSGLRILAEECHGLSIELILLLEKVKSKNPGSKAQNLLSALRNKVYDSERASLEARLNECRGQLHLQLSHLTRKETLEKLDILVQASKADQTKLDKIESQVAQLRKSISLTPATSEVKLMLMTLLEEEEKVFNVIAQERILNSLSFEGMNRRSNMVVETNSNTYEWILEDKPTDETVFSELLPEHAEDAVAKEAAIQLRDIEDVEKTRARDKLNTWLARGSSRDVFHLSGKLGSGKSTLMKYIRESSRTQDRLKIWADGRELTIADFYFWNAGSDYEKSLRGLYTSLLYQIFSQCPDLVPKVWPAQWAQANSAPWLTPKVIEISGRDINEAFATVIKSHDWFKKRCFAFFIDGLDEFQSTVQADHRDLVKPLCHWAVNASENVKICVSSREYPVFMDGFTSTLRISLHELTRHDMNMYIRDKLAHVSAEEHFESLVSLIMSKANGVFLWVALVVKSLREEVENGMSCYELTREVDVLPEQLESLYSHIIKSLGKSARRKAYQTFCMITELKRHGDYRMSLLAYSFLEEYESGNDFFMDKNNVFPFSSLTGNRGKDRAQSSSRKLAGWCKGLVEPYKMRIWAPSNENNCNAAWENWSLELDFVHRSVAEFLRSDEIQHDMELNLVRFDHIDAILNIIVSDIIYENASSSYNTSRSGTTTTVLLEILERYELYREPFTYLERLQELLATGGPREPTPLDTTLLIPWQGEDGQYYYGSVAKCTGAATDKLSTTDETVSNEEKRSLKDYLLSDPLPRLTWLGLCDYPLWCIANRHKLFEQPETISMIACFCIRNGMTWGYRNAHRALRVLEALFERDWLSPNTITSYRPFFFMEDSNHVSGNIAGLTFWQHLLIHMLGEHYFLRIPRTSGERKIGDVKEHRSRLAKYRSDLCGLCLRYKADTEFLFTLCENEEKSESRDFLFNFGRQGLVKFTAPSHFHSRKPWQDIETGLQSEDGAPLRRDFSLREFIEIVLSDHRDTDHKDTILQILDEQSEQVDTQTDTGTAAASVAGQQDCDGKESVLEDEVRFSNSRNRFQYQPSQNTGFRYCLQAISRLVNSLLNNEYFSMQGGARITAGRRR